MAYCTTVNGMKRCRLCGEVKPVAAFHYTSHVCKNGVKSPFAQCKKCRSISRISAGGRERRRLRKLRLKRCAQCKEIKPQTEFYTTCTGGSQLLSYCKVCISDRQSQRMQHAHETKERKRLFSIGKKKCRKCGEIKYLDQFYQKNSGKPRSVCKACEYTGTPQERLSRRIAAQKRRVLETAGPGVTTADWQAILARYNRRCAYCGDQGELEMDHVMPLSRGGHHSTENIVPACYKCNRRKHVKIDWEPKIFPAQE